MAHYIIRPQADADLDEYAAHIAEDNLQAALGLYDAAEETYQKLAQFKEMGEVYNSSNPFLKNIRFFPISGSYIKYLVFYIPYENHIEIVRVINKARKIRNILG